MPRPDAHFFIPKLDSLPQGQRALWTSLGAIAQDGFVLYGGTAISLRLGHRVSVDFDFFTEAPVDQDSILNRYPFCSEATVLQAAPNTLSILVPGSPEGVKLSFFGGITHGRTGEPAWTQDGVLQVASLQDLLGTKLKTIQQRVEKKDYLDIHALLASGLRLEDGLATAQALYGKTFHPMVAVKALGYFGDGDLKELPVQVQRALTTAINKTSALPPIPAIVDSLRGGA